jgi:hypothetical protein
MEDVLLTLFDCDALFEYLMPISLSVCLLFYLLSYLLSYLLFHLPIFLLSARA